MGILLKTEADLVGFVESERGKGKTVVFTNGCFDILHAGHVDYLEKARSFGDVLLVGVNSDASVKKIKGSKRPIISEDMRVRVLMGLGCVDAVYVFDEETPYNVIRLVRPDVLVKGADWGPDKIVGREFAGKVKTIPFKFDVSTSRIISTIVNLYCDDS